MSDFLGGLKELLGGWNAARRIDKEGFDWREQAQQAELQRQQQARQFEQANEDWATRAGGQAALGAEEGEDISGLIPYPQGANQQRVMARVRGALAESKPALESMKANAAYSTQLLKGSQSQALQELKGLQKLKEIAASADERESIVRLQEDLLNDRQPSPRDLANWQAMKERVQMGGTFRPFVTPTGELAGFFGTKPGPGGQIPTLPLPPGMAGARTAPLPAAAQESLARGGTALASIANIEKMLSKRPAGEEWTGPMAKLEYRARSGQGIPGFLGDVFGAEPPSGEQAILSTEVAQLGNRAIQDITGAQVGQHEVPRLFTEIPTLEDRGEVLLAKLAVTKYRLELLDALRRGQITRDQAIQQINDVSSQNYLEQYRQQGLGAGAAPTAGKYMKTRR